ncbi:MAG: hypothetical protein ABI183_20440 [Polyangiaceae bacterium]
MMKLRHSATRAFRLLIALTPLTLLGCANDSQRTTAPPPESSPAALPAGYVAHLEPSPGIRFPMPAKGITATVEDFDATLPAEKFRHEVHLGSDVYVQVLIHVWDNPRHLDTHTWFDENLSGFVDESTSVSERPATKNKIPAIVLEQPASDQAVSQSVAVFATRDHVYSVTCMDPVNDLGAKTIFDNVVFGFEPEIAPVVSAKAVTR